MEKRDNAYYLTGILDKLNMLDRNEYFFRHGIMFDLRNNDMHGYKIEKISRIIRDYMHSFLRMCSDYDVEIPERFYMAEDVLDYLLSYFYDFTKSAILQKEKIMKKRSEMNPVLRIITAKKYKKGLKEALSILVLRYNALALELQEIEIDKLAEEVLSYSLHKNSVEDTHIIIDYHSAFYKKIGYEDISNQIKQRD